ncbi:MAG: acyl-[acyl-carrier-protein] thioesterase [Lachnospiraceae bacterium]|nr:acyl-[acyl-carrier-protein] thioesterase [Lachnospiraceae bacterium]
MYTFESRIRYSEVGEDRLLTPASLIDYFQDCSTFQSEDVGMGLEYLRSEKMAWYVIFWQLDIFRRPKLAERILTGTSPYAMKGFLGYRNFMMETLEGERLVEANSVWSLMNTETMRPVRVPLLMAERYGVNDPLPMEYRDRKIVFNGLAGHEASEGDIITVSEQHLDSNHHVNNGQYVSMALEFLPADVTIRQLRAEYKKQAFLGDVIHPFVAREESRITVALMDGQGKTFAIVEFEL